MAGCNTYGERLVTVFVNGDCVGTAKMFVKDRSQILLEEINDSASPLHFLQDIVQSIKDTKSESSNASIDVKLLDGTKQLLKKLAQLSGFSEGNNTVMTIVTIKKNIQFDEWFDLK